MTNHDLMPGEESPAPAVAQQRYANRPPRCAHIDIKKFAARLDLGGLKSGSWVESMKASSPTQRRGAAVSPLSLEDEEYEEWTEAHPSALREFGAVAAAAKGKQVVMFLDYDGTLSPIVEDPDAAIMTEEMRDAVRGVAEQFPTAIVTGRCRDKVFGFVKLPQLYYAGSHGMDIKGPSSDPKQVKSQARGVLFQPAAEFLPMIQEVFTELTEKMAGIPGARVENNKFCISVHFRCVDGEKWETLFEQVKGVMKDYPNLRLTQGRMVLEIRPVIKWDKGRALEFLLESLGYAERSDVYPIYIGDDRTDEDAFKVLANRGQGIGILVSKFPKDTNACYSLRDPAEVKEFLCKLVKWGNGNTLQQHT